MLRRRACVLTLTLALTACASHPPPLTGPPVISARDRAVRHLQQDLATILEDPALAHSTFSVTVESLTRGDTLFSYRPDTLLMPASTLKLVTLAAAAERLGWDFAFETRVDATGPIVDGVLSGDLVIHGSGDPTIERRDNASDAVLADWAQQLWDRGLRRIDGRIVGDDNAFDDSGLGRGWAWDDLAYGYAAPGGALQINDNSALLELRPAAVAGEAAQVVLSPAESGLLVESRLVTGAAGTAAAYAFQRAPDSAIVRVWGTLPVGTAPQVRPVAVENPTLYFVRMVRSALARQGIAVTGGVADIDDVATPPVSTGAPLIVQRSAPLRDIGRVMMKTSDNVYAETVLRATGRTAAGQATAAGALQTVSATLASWGVPDGSVVQADGSGLSPYNLVTTRALATVLRHMFTTPERDAWLETLPIASTDGTLRARFTGTAAVGRVKAKTGTLTNARALAGYVQAADGEWLAFALVVNNSGVGRQNVDAVTDRAILRLVGFTR